MWYVVYDTTGSGEGTYEVYQSADSYSDAIVACNALSALMPSWLCEVMDQASAEAL